MPQTFIFPTAVLAASFAFSIAATLLVRAAAARMGFVAKPKSDRWHKRPTAMLGGIAIFLTTIVFFAAFVPKRLDVTVVLTGASFLFIVGLVDDLITIKPYQKLIGQLMGASLVVGFGLVLPITGNELLDIWITAFWLIGITNAVNLLDNMDGLAAGIALIAAGSMAFGFALNGQTDELVLMIIFIGGLAGFLVFNFNPASIFMGDCGSMFVGFFLGASVLIGQTGGRSRGILSILAVPVLILFVPIFDTTLVTVLRKMWGRKASQGGKDHTSHRHVALGLSERSAVLMIYAFAVCAGVLSLLVSKLGAVSSLALIGVFTVVLSFIGVYLSNVKVYEEQQEELAVRDNAVFAFIVNVSYKRRVFEVLLDTFLISVSYYFSYVLLFGSFEESGNWPLFVATLPLLIVLKLFAFLAAGVYRGLWRYTSIGDFITFAQGVAAGSVLSVVAILIIYRFQNFSRAVFVIDGIILLMAISSSRMAFRVIRELLPMPHQAGGRRVLIYGAGDGGELVLRELKNNPSWNYHVVGFVDDDPQKRDKLIKGLRVWDANGSLEKICRESSVEEILISTTKISGESIARAREICHDFDISLKRAYLKIEPMDIE